MFDEVVSIVAEVMEAGGVGVMVVGLVITLVLAISELRSRSASDTYRSSRRRIGQSILLGLELLVAADILRTVSKMPSLHEIGVLAAIVALRTFLSFTLEIELTGRLPWRDDSKQRDENRRHGGDSQR